MFGNEHTDALIVYLFAGVLWAEVMRQVAFGAMEQEGRIRTWFIVLAMIASVLVWWALALWFILYVRKNRHDQQDTNKIRRMLRARKNGRGPWG